MIYASYIHTKFATPPITAGSRRHAVGAVGNGSLGRSMLLALGEGNAR